MLWGVCFPDVSDIIIYKSNGRSPVKEFVEKIAKKGDINELTPIIAYQQRLQECGMQVNN
jgi:hypothetical protein